jgi:hypothetical protein
MAEEKMSKEEQSKLLDKLMNETRTSKLLPLDDLFKQEMRSLFIRLSKLPRAGIRLIMDREYHISGYEHDAWYRSLTIIFKELLSEKEIEWNEILKVYYEISNSYFATKPYLPLTKTQTLDAIELTIDFYLEQLQQQSIPVAADDPRRKEFDIEGSKNSYEYIFYQLFIDTDIKLLDYSRDRAMLREIFLHATNKEYFVNVLSKLSGKFRQIIKLYNEVFQDNWYDSSKSSLSSQKGKRYSKKIFYFHFAERKFAEQEHYKFDLDPNLFEELGDSHTILYIYQLWIFIREEFLPESEEPVAPKIQQLRPRFQESIHEPLFQLLKPYFEATNHKDLKDLIVGKYEQGNPLVFIGKGNLLADVFRQLFETNLLLADSKKTVEQWAQQHFMYVSKKNPTTYTAKYLSKIISAQEVYVKKPIVKISKNSSGDPMLTQP